MDKTHEDGSWIARSLGLVDGARLQIADMIAHTLMSSETQGVVAPAHTDDLGRGASPSPAPLLDYATPFARDLALALTDPVIVALLAQIVRQGIEHDRIMQIARASAARDATPSPPPTNVQRASSRTDWVGQRFATQFTKQQEESARAAQPEGDPA